MKRILITFLAFCIVMSFSSCSIGFEDGKTDCDHIWISATCDSPKKCRDCGILEGLSLGHSYESATCTSPEKCSRCGFSVGFALGHDYEGGFCTRCYEKDPSYVSRDTYFPDDPEALGFDMNSVGGIDFHWKQRYRGNKKINYITVTYTLYDAVGNPTPDDIKRKSTNRIRLIGPFNANSMIDFYADVFVYCDVCNKISFDSLYLEFADGTTAQVDYGWQNSVY